MPVMVMIAVGMMIVPAMTVVSVIMRVRVTMRMLGLVAERVSNPPGDTRDTFAKRSCGRLSVGRSCSDYDAARRNQTSDGRVVVAHDSEYHVAQ
jgi:hypothetical protein